MNATDSPTPLESEKTTLREETHRRLIQLGVTDDPPGRIPSFSGEGQAAEQLRRLEPYRAARVVFCAPDSVLRQVRINALVDGKRLITATPALKSGLVEITRSSLPPWKFAWALSGEGLRQHGRQLTLARRDAGNPIVDVLITGAVAVDANGGRLGKGAGYFDLEFALFAAAGWIDPAVCVAAVVHQHQVINHVPMAAHDVPVDLIITPQQVIVTSRSGPRSAQLTPSLLTRRAASLPIVRAALAQFAGHNP